MKNKTILFLLIILAVSAFFRLWQLDKIPPGIWPDEAVNATDALKTLKTGNFRLFYPENNGREGLFMWLLAVSFSIFGVSVWSLKIVPAVIGILTVFGLYLLSREMFLEFSGEKLGSSSIDKRARTAALLSSFFLAISLWHINFSRIAFRAILVPLILTFSFYFFFRGLRTKKILDFIASGAIFGIGFYTYTSFRLAVLLLGFALIFWALEAFKQKWVVKYVISGALLLIAVFIVALPIGIYFLQNPTHFIQRALGVSVFEQAEPAKEFLKSLVLHLAMFNFRGDSNWRHNLSGFPQLSPLAGILFIIGVITGISRLNGQYLFLFLWIFTLLLPGALTVEGIPHALRTIGVIPAVYILTAVGALTAYDWISKKWRLKWLSLGLLFAMAIYTFSIYFFVWAKSPELKSAFPLEFNNPRIWNYQIK